MYNLLITINEASAKHSIHNDSPVVTLRLRGRLLAMNTNSVDTGGFCPPVVHYLKNNAAYIDTDIADDGARGEGLDMGVIMNIIRKVRQNEKQPVSSK